MLIVLKPNVSREEIDHIVDKIRSLNLEPHVSTGVQRTIITVIGDEDVIREQPLEALAGVESVKSILRPFKLVSSETQPDRSIIRATGGDWGKKHRDRDGPCSVRARPRNRTREDGTGVGRAHSARGRSSRVHPPIHSRASACRASSFWRKPKPKRAFPL
jgi:3-deoxy-7-phosphoheptulonate synthase